MSLNPTPTDHVDASIGTDCKQNRSVHVKINTSDRLSLVVEVKLLGSVLLCVTVNTDFTSDLAGN